MTIVVGYSPSGQGDAALRSAAREAARTGQDMVVASHPYHDPDRGPSVASAGQVRSALEAVGAGEGSPVIRESGPEEDIGEFLLSVAEQEEASLIVIGLRWKSPIGKLNLGASARRVVLGASCPVLTVKDARPGVSGAVPVVDLPS